MCAQPGAQEPATSCTTALAGVREARARSRHLPKRGCRPIDPQGAARQVELHQEQQKLKMNDVNYIK